MKLLVTGGAGFIGTNFIHLILRERPEWSVVNLDALTYAGNLENHAESEKNPQYAFVKGDICDAELVDRLVSEVDAVVHFAAETHVDRSIIDAEAFVRTNMLGTLVLLNAVKKHGTRFHHVSTDEVFGDLAPNDPPFSETTPYAPTNPYSATKAGSDHLVRAYIHTHGVQATISNCTNNYGPWHFPEKMIPLFISNLQEGKTVPVYGDGLQVRDWIFAEDHARGILAVLEKGKVGETYGFGGGNGLTNLEVTKKLVALLGRGEDAIQHVKDRPGHDRRYEIDFSKATRELGWMPRVTLDEGLKLTVEWFNEHKDWAARCKSGEYQTYYAANYDSKIA